MSLRALLSVFVVFASVLIAAAVQADAASPGVCPGGSISVSSYATLQSDLSDTTSGTVYCLTASLADSSTTTGGLVVNTPAAGSLQVTVDLNGYNLTISHAGTGTAGITDNAALYIEDTSSTQAGVLTVTGGAASSTKGAGAGITGGNTVTVESGTVHATGGAASTGSTNNSGAGAGIGGDGGAPGSAGAIGQGFLIDGGTVVATGGASNASGTNNGGAGAGIGGGGGGSGALGGGNTVPNSGVINEVFVTGGSVTATGGASQSSGINNAGAGSGIGGGGGGGVATSGGGGFEGGTPGEILGIGGSISVAPGTTTGSTGALSGAVGVGDGGGTGLVPYPNSNRSNGGQISDFSSGTTTVSGEWDGGIVVGGNATLAVASGAALTLGTAGGSGSAINGGLSVPASSSLNIDNEGLDLTVDGSETIAGQLNEDAGGFFSVGTSYPETGNLTLADPGAISGAFQIGNSITVTIPAAQTLDLGGANTTGEPDVNDGTIALAGTLTGSTTLINNGAIQFDGSAASVTGNGQGQNGQLTITVNNYHLTFSVPSPGTAPADMYVFAPTLAAGGESLPAEPTISGLAAQGGWESGTTTVSQNSVLANFADPNNTVALMGKYSGLASVSQAPSETTASLGDAVTDTVNVAGNATYGSPTGPVYVYVCGPLSSASGCSDTTYPVGGATPLSAAGGNDSSAQSASFTPTVVGTYCFYAYYAGDGNNTAAADSGNDGCFLVTNGPSSAYGAPSLATVVAGNSDTDVATIFASPGGPAPTGDVSFFACGPSNSPVDCITQGMAIGSSALTPGTNGTSTATSPAFTAPTAGTYCFRVVYAGDAANLGSADGNSSTQCFVVQPAATTAATPTSSASTTVEGQPVELSTTVTPSGTSVVPNGGEVTFFVDGDDTLCRADVVSGHAACQTSGLFEGTNSITARYDGNDSFAASPMSSALSITVSGNSAFTAAVASNTASKSLAVKVALHSTGALKVAASLGKRTVTHSQKVTLAKTAKTTTVSLRLALKSLLRGHSGTVKVRLAITFKPTVGKARTVIKTVRIRIAKR